MTDDHPAAAALTPPTPSAVPVQGHPTVLLDPLPFDPKVVAIAADAARSAAEKRKRERGRVRWVGRHDVDFEDRKPPPAEDAGDMEDA